MRVTPDEIESVVGPPDTKSKRDPVHEHLVACISGIAGIRDNFK